MLPRCLIIIFIFINQLCFSQKLGSEIARQLGSECYFIKNEGQLLNESGRPADEVLFYCRLAGCNVFFTRDALIYDFFEQNADLSSGNRKSVLDISINPTDKKNIAARHYRIDMNLLKTNQEKTIGAKGRKTTNNNYYRGGEQLYAFKNIPLYDTLVYQNIYPEIDLVFYLLPGGKGLKYDYIVHPGGNPQQIGYLYSYKDNISINNSGELSIKTPLGVLIEGKPYTYQGEQEIRSSFDLHSDTIRFKTAAYNNNIDLVIDPSILVWSTYYGGNGDSDQSMHIERDSEGNLVISGLTNSVNFPVSPGASQSNAGGGGSLDAFVMKFSDTGSRLWATYLGGSKYDISRSCITDQNNNIFIVGTTMSLDFPLLNPGGGAYFLPTNAPSTLISTNPTAFISKFNPNGNMLWSTYFGGNIGENGVGIWIDSSNDLIVTGSSASNVFPVTPGAFQSTMMGPGGIGALGDVFLAKFSNSGVQKWATLIGGSRDEVGYDICTDPMGNIFMTGFTNSPDFPVSTDAYQSSWGGGRDLFFARFSASGSRIWSSYYGGSGDERGYGILSEGNHLYANGYSSGNLPGPSSGVFQPSNAGGIEDGILVKLEKDASPNQILWRTFLGGNSDDGFDEISLNNDGEIVCAGWTNSTNFPTTPNAYQPPHGGGYDGQYASFDTEGRLLCSSYFGGSDDDAIYGLAIASNNDVFISGYTGSSQSQGFTITNGAFQQAINTPNDAFIARITEHTPAPIADFNANPLNGCAPLTVHFENKSISNNTCKSNTTWEWSFPGGVPSVSTDENPPPITYSTGGNYTATLKVTNASGTSSSTKEIIADAMVIASVSNDTSICAGGTGVQLTASGGENYNWSPATGLSSVSGAIVTATPTVTTTYTVSVSKGTCPPEDIQVTVTVISPPSITISRDTAFCKGERVQLIATGASNYRWSPAGGLSCTNCPSPTANPSNTITYTVIGSENNDCPSVSKTVTLTVYPPPQASVVESQSIPKGQSVTLQAGGGVAYLWLTDSSSAETLIVNPNENTIYCVEVTDANNCIDTACATITVTEKLSSTLWIPNSFSPNEDPVNSVFKTPGENIIEYHAYIFNRWGELIFDWTDIEKGWDGTAKGQPVQDDVYAYRVRALGIDGIKYNKRGIIIVFK